MSKIKALLLIPIAFAGAFTVLTFSIPPRTTFDILFPVAILVPLYLGHFALLAWMWTQPFNRAYLGHSRRTWSFLMFVAYLAGTVSMLLT